MVKKGQVGSRMIKKITIRDLEPKVKLTEWNTHNLYIDDFSYYVKNYND